MEGGMEGGDPVSWIDTGHAGQWRWTYIGKFTLVACNFTMFFSDWIV